MAGNPESLETISVEALASTQVLVTRSLRSAILKGLLKPGERLQQDKLAAQLGVSRQPVREALRQLQSEGLVSSGAHRGAMVREYSEEDVRDNYRLRALLEAYAAHRATIRISDSQLRDIETINDTMRRELAIGEALERIVELNTSWHKAVHAAACMPTLSRLIAQLWIGYTIFMPLAPGRAEKSVNEHADVIAAFKLRDPDAASAAMRHHLELAELDYFTRAENSVRPD